MGWTALALGAASAIGGAASASAASSAAGAQTQATEDAINTQNANLARSRNDLAPYRVAGNQALDRLSSLLGLNTLSDWGNTQLSNGKSAVQEAIDRINARTVPKGNELIENSKQNNPQFYQDEIMGEIPGIQKDFGITGPTTSADSGSLLRSFSKSDLDADPIYKDALDFSTSQGEKAINNRAASTGSYDSGAALKALAKFDQGNVTQYGNDAFSRYETSNNDKFSRLSSLAGVGENAAAMTGQSGANAANNISSLQSGLGNALGASAIAGGNAISGGINNGINAYNSQNLLAQLTGGGARGLDGYATGMGDIRSQINSLPA